MTGVDALRLDAKQMITDIRHRLARCQPIVVTVFEGYAGELLAACDLLEPNLKHLAAGAQVLEIGAGSLMVSCLLQKQGFAVTALEPVGVGFSHFAILQAQVLDYARARHCMPEVLAHSAESLDRDASFDFAFSINVMEHVEQFDVVLERVTRALRSGACYRFICPNYAFPYEPHFNLPTLFNRALTGYLLGPWIRKSSRVVDPNGTWRSLNWITVRKVRRACRRRNLPMPQFNASVFETYLKRALLDTEFQSRRSGWIIASLKWLELHRVLSFSRFFPVALLPVMDCTISREERCLT